MQFKYRIKIKATDGHIYTYETYEEARWWNDVYNIKVNNKIIQFPARNVVWVSKEKIESEKEPVNLEKES